MAEDVIMVRDLMTPHIIWIEDGESVTQAAKVMTERNISSLLVKRSHEYVGILTDMDIITRVVAKRLNPEGATVKSVMSSPLITIKPNAGLDEASDKMRRNHIRRLVVEDDSGIIGIISESDLIRVEPEIHLLIREHSRLELSPSEEEDMDFRRIRGVCEECQNFSEDLTNVDGRWLCELCS